MVESPTVPFLLLAGRAVSPVRALPPVTTCACAALRDNLMYHLVAFASGLGVLVQTVESRLGQVWTSRLGRKWSGVSRQHANKTVLDTHLNAFVVDNPKLQDFRDQRCGRVHAAAAYPHYCRLVCGGYQGHPQRQLAKLRACLVRLDIRLPGCLLRWCFQESAGLTNSMCSTTVRFITRGSAVTRAGSS